MLKHTSHKSGFTLLELLVTASIAVVLLGMTASLFASLGKLAADRKNGLAVTSQIDQAINRMEVDMENAVPDDTVNGFVNIFTLGKGSGEPTEALYIKTMRTSTAGVREQVWRVYCMSGTTASKNGQLTVFTLPGTRVITAATLPTYAGCENVMLGMNAGSGTPEEKLTDSSTLFVQDLAFRKISHYDVTSPSPAVSAVRVEFRVGMTTAQSGDNHRITIRRQVNR